jgi:hypothetical protein
LIAFDTVKNRRLGYAVDPTASMTGRWATDNTGAISLNGASTGNTSTDSTAFTPFSITSGFVVGLNTLDFIVDNTSCVGLNCFNPTGLRVELTGTMSPSPSPNRPCRPFSCAPDSLSSRFVVVTADRVRFNTSLLCESESGVPKLLSFEQAAIRLSVGTRFLASRKAGVRQFLLPNERTYQNAVVKLISSKG